MAKTSLSIVGMHCASCARLIQKSLEKTPGVTAAAVNYGSEQAAVEYDPAKVYEKDLVGAVEKVGYAVSKAADKEKIKLQELKSLKVKVIVSAIFSLLIFFVPIPILVFAFATVVQFWAGFSFYQATWSGLKNKTASMDTLVVLGTSVAWFYSTFVVLFPTLASRWGFPATLYFDTSAVIITLVLLGRYLENRAKAHTADAIKKLLDLAPKMANMVRNGLEISVSVSTLKEGDLIRVRPGETIAVDGVICEGESAVDESMISGEAILVEKKKGDRVIGGTLNKSGSFIFKATKVGTDTMLSRIVALVSEAQGSRAQIQALADTVSAYFVPVVLGLAVLTLVGWLIFGAGPTHALLNMIAVLVIACPCAMGLATPTAIMVGVGRGAQKGILIRDAQSLEMASQVKTVIFDKTGTLTLGKPVLTGFSGDKKALAIAASLEQGSEHPLAKAILDKAQKENIRLQKVAGFKAQTGLGVEGNVNGKKYFLGKNQKGEIVLKQGDVEIAAFTFKDTLKKGVNEVVRELEKNGREIWMVTGDNEVRAREMGRAAGIKNILAGVFPGDKADKVRTFNKVAFVGDGINDAPALASADVGMAMGTGSDVAIESAGITLLNKDFRTILQAFNLSTATMKVIRQNLFWAFGYNVILIPIAALGLLNPMFASLAMAASSISVVLNSLRLRMVRI